MKELEVRWWAKLLLGIMKLSEFLRHAVSLILVTENAVAPIPVTENHQEPKPPVVIDADGLMKWTCWASMRTCVTFQVKVLAAKPAPCPNMKMFMKSNERIKKKISVEIYSRTVKTCFLRWPG